MQVQPALNPAGLTLSGTDPKRQRCYFTPADDQQLSKCKSRRELLDAIVAIVADSGYSRRNVVNHAKELGVWDKFPEQPVDEGAMVRLLSASGCEEDPLDLIAAKLCITKAAARRRVYRNDDCLEHLVGGTYSAREVAEGLCMHRSTLKRFIESGVLRAKKLQRSGKLRISSEAIVEFVRSCPRQIPWDRCLSKSSWLRDILEGTRYQQVAALLCISPKTLRSWIERGIVNLTLDCRNVSSFFSDEPIYRLLDEFPHLVNATKCAAANPEWFARYEAVRGRYPQRDMPAEKNKIDQVKPASFRLLVGRS